MGDDVISRGMRMFTMPYGPKWRTYRSIVHQLVSATMTATFIPTQEYETKQLLFDLATDNANQRDFYLHLRCYAFSIIMTSTYGNRVNSYDHDDVKHADQSSRIIGQITRAGAFIVDEIPVLAYLPAWLQPGRRRAQEIGVPLLEAKMRLWRRLQKQMEAGYAPMCYARDMMEKSDSWRKEGLTDEDAAWIAGGIVEVGSHTSSTTLFNLVKYLAAYPRAQQVAHDELMRVVGLDRTPTYDDTKTCPTSDPASRRCCACAPYRFRASSIMQMPTSRIRIMSFPRVRFSWRTRAPSTTILSATTSLTHTSLSATSIMPSTALSTLHRAIFTSVTISPLAVEGASVRALVSRRTR